MGEMDTQSFFATHPVFTVDEFDRFLESRGTTDKNSRHRLLVYHHRGGKLALIRAGLYAAVPLGAVAKTYPVDSYLVAACLRPDAVIGYHSALTFHGVAHSLREERIVITQRPLAGPFAYQGVIYRTVLPPLALRLADELALGVVRQERQNQYLSVTSLERTLVDCLDRPKLGGDWEEVWRSYESVPYLDLDLVVRYALALENATTIATVGYFLQQLQQRWMVGEEQLDTLRSRKPHQPHYLGRTRNERGRLSKEWNLVVPERIVLRTWEEPDEPFA